MRLFLVFALVWLAGCVSSSKKIDPEHRHVLGEFAFRFAMGEGWVEGPATPGTFIAGVPPNADGSTLVAAFRTGPVSQDEAKDLTPQEIFKGFKEQIEKDSSGGRVESVKSVFAYRRQQGAECLFYNQTGNDRGAAKLMTLVSDGVICLHPRKPKKFAWMIMSERHPIGKPARAGFEEARNRYFDSLEFL